MEKIKKELAELLCGEDLKLVLNSLSTSEVAHNYTKEELFYIEVRLSKYSNYIKWKSYKTNLINNTKEKLLSCLSKSVDYNSENPNNKCIRQLNKKALVDKNIISIFESTLTRTLEIPKDELSEDIFVVQVYYFDMIKDLILNGFEHNGEKYKFLTASAGQIRTKKTVFIKESQWKKHQKSLMCGLTLDSINEQGGVNVN